MWDLPTQRTDTVPALLAHAIAIEREAVERYAEFAARMRDLGNDEAAGVFAALARLQGSHLETLKQRARGMELPQVDASQHAWLDSGAPVPAARELVFRMMTPRDAIQIALNAERRADACLLRLQRVVTAPEVRVLAQESLGPGAHGLEWNADDDAGQRVAPGRYFVRVRAGQLTRTVPVTVLR